MDIRHAADICEEGVIILWTEEEMRQHNLLFRTTVLTWQQCATLSCVKAAYDAPQLDAEELRRLIEDEAPTPIEGVWDLALVLRQNVGSLKLYLWDKLCAPGFMFWYEVRPVAREDGGIVYNIRWLVREAMSGIRQHEGDWYLSKEFITDTFMFGGKEGVELCSILWMLSTWCGFHKGMRNKVFLE